MKKQVSGKGSQNTKGNKKNPQYLCTHSSQHPSTSLRLPPGHEEFSPPFGAFDAQSPTRPGGGQARPLECSPQRTTFSRFRTRKRSRYDREKKTEQIEREKNKA